MGISRPLIFEIANNTWLINEFGLNNVYVLKGRDRSLVIDAGSGYCDMRSLVESLVDTPYDVVATHAHNDSVGAMRQYESIRINELDWPRLPTFLQKNFSMEEFQLKSALRIGDWDIWDVTPQMVNCGSCNTLVTQVDAGDVFDLGDRRVTAYSLPGHTRGHMYYIDDQSRIAFAGDAVNTEVCIHCPVSVYLEHLEGLIRQHGKLYDRIFLAHTAFCGELSVRSLDFSVVERLAETCRRVLRGEATVELRSNRFHPRKKPRETAVYGEGGQQVCLAFKSSRLYTEDDTQPGAELSAGVPFPAAAANS